MFSGLVNLLFGSSETEDIRKRPEPFDTEQSISNNIVSELLSTEAAEEDDWLLVNKKEEDNISLSSNDSEEAVTTTRRTELAIPRHCSTSAKRPARYTLREAHTNNVRLSSPTNIPSPSSMEESWFITPPPCFTSTGPVLMTTSPYENLLIEHPSMSVYHNMTYVREIITQCNITPPPANEVVTEIVQEYPKPPVGKYLKKNRRNRKERKPQRELRTSDFKNIITEVVGRRHPERVYDKREHDTLCRGALKRANKVREFNGNGNRQRRSDLQHSRFLSRANNNRKC